MLGMLLRSFTVQQIMCKFEGLLSCSSMLKALNDGRHQYHTAPGVVVGINVVGSRSDTTTFNCCTLLFGFYSVRTAAKIYDPVGCDARLAIDTRQTGPLPCTELERGYHARGIPAVFAVR